MPSKADIQKQPPGSHPVYPLLVYGFPFCYPRFKKDVARLNKFLNYFSKMVYLKCNLPKSDSSSRLRNLGLVSIENVYLYTGLVYIFKIIHHLAPSPPFFPPVMTSSTRGHSKKLPHLYCRTDLRKSFFYVRLIPLWNSLSGEVVPSRSISHFKRFLRSSDFSEHISKGAFF